MASSGIPTSARGGGSATTAGIEFQAKLGAWFAAHVLAERPLEAQLTGRRIDSVRFETEAPVDDILLETGEGRIFVQAKTSLNLSVSRRSEFTKVADQFARQWIACAAGDGGRGWNRPLRPDRDRLVLAVGPGASRAISIDLVRGLTAIQSSGSAPVPQGASRALKSLETVLSEAFRAVAGRTPTPDDIRAILNLITIRKFDFGAADTQLAEELIVHVIDSREQSTASLAVVTDICQALMRQRAGFDMRDLRRALIARHVPVKEPPSFHSDVSRLKTYSDSVRRQLSEYELTNVSGTQIHIERQCTDAVVDAALRGSLLLVGEPGAGKSAVINAGAAKLRESGHDVVELAVDRLPVQSLPELATELELTHSFREVLLNWPGDDPAFLCIDALDATRGGENEAVFRALIADVLAFEGRQWHVIASIRTFDLRLGEQFRRLFRGQPPDRNFADPAFQDVVHIHVPPWTGEELESLLAKAPALATAIRAGSSKLRELALVPFNTRLLADLISEGVAPSAFGEVRSQVQLLRMYWSSRVERHGAGGELCLRAAVRQMLETRSLRARKLDVAEADPSGVRFTAA